MLNRLLLVTKARANNLLLVNKNLSLFFPKAHVAREHLKNAKNLVFLITRSLENQLGGLQEIPCLSSSLS